MVISEGKISRDPLGVVRYIFPVCALAFLYHRADDVGLAALADLFLNKRIGLGAVGGSHHAVFNRKTHGRELVNDGNIQVTVYNNGQSPGNRGGAHNQNVRRIASCGQRFPLLHAEAVLLVCDDKAKVFVNHFLLDQGVGANDHVGLAGCNLSVDSPLLFQSGGAGQKHWMAGGDSLFLHKFGKGLEVLVCQNLCGHHQRCLVAVFHGQDHGKEGQDGFAASNISLNQSGHKSVAAKIPLDLMPGV